LLLAHLDVVEARREDWTFDPFKFTELDGYFYGRGTNDIKSGDALLVANLIRMKQEGFQPDRDIIVALTADEEGGSFNGVDWLVRNHRDLIDAAYCLNTDGGGGEIKKGKRMLNELQTSEKVYLSFSLEVTNRGGHSSLPEKENAIYRLAEGLERLAKFDFPVKLNETTRSYFEKMSRIESDQTGRDMAAIAVIPPDPQAAERLAATPYYNALMRTTCVATELEAGHAENALPQRARAVVNCRLLPEDSPADVQQTLVRVLADDKITITPLQTPRQGPLSPLVPEVVDPIERITAELWPGVPVVPIMSTGATDGLRLRIAGIPTYGVSGLFDDIDDVRAHGKDERMGVREFFDGLEFMYRLVKTLSSSSSALVPPPRRRRAVGFFGNHERRDFLEPFRGRGGSGPAVRLAITVQKEPLVVRLLGRLHPFLELLRGVVQLESVHRAGVDVDLVDDLRSDSRPVLFQVFEQVEVFLPVPRYRGIHLAGHLVEERFEIAIVAERTENGRPDVDLLTRPAVRAVHQLEVIALLGCKPDAAIGLT
jgi:acetylornithine deacetylase/succinyl-diaminopimelate desuccinylase-like protein